MSLLSSSPRLEFALAVVAFAFWGVISRSIHLPAPMMLTIICAAGAITCACAGKGPIKWSIDAVVVGLILSGDLLLLILAFQRVDFATVVALHNAGPLLVVMLAPRLTGDSFKLKSLLLAAIGVAAVAVICGVKFGRLSASESNGVVLALLSAGTLAANILTQRRLMKSGMSYRSAVLQYNIVLTIVYAALSFFSEDVRSYAVSFARPAIGEIVLAVIAGIVTQGFAMMFFNSAARRLTSETMARLSLLGPALTVMTGIVFYAERPGFAQMAAMLVIFGVSVVPVSMDEVAATPSDEHSEF